MKKSNLKTIYVYEIRGLFLSLRAYIYFAVMLAGTVLYVSYINFYNGIPGFEYTLGYISNVLMLALPALTVDMFSYPKREGPERMMFAAGVGRSELFFGKLFAVITVFLISVAVLAVFPPVFGAFVSVAYASAYIGLVGFSLFGIALICVFSLVSLLCRERIFCFAVSYGLLFLFYIGKTVYGIISVNSAAVFMVFLVYGIAFGAAFYGLTGNKIAGLSVFAAVSVVGAVMSFAFTLQAFLFIKKLLAFTFLIPTLSNFLYGVLDIRAVLSLLIFIAAVCAVSVVCLQKRKYE